MAPRIANWIFLFFLGLVGIYSLLLGGFLIYLGGSFYYALVGIAVLVLCKWVYKADARALKLFAAILLLSLFWSVYEADWQFLALLPRVAMWLVLGPVVFKPLVPTWIAQSAFE